MRRLPILLLLCGLLSSCAVYDTSFSCKPCQGIKCSSITEIESMIVETRDGPDRIERPERSSFTCHCGRRVQTDPRTTPSPFSRRVWIAEKRLPNGVKVDGHYVYLPEICREG